MNRLHKSSLYLVLAVILSFANSRGNAQFFQRNDTIPVVMGTDTLSLPWAGGFESPQFSEIDLNGDGIKDLFVFDKVGDKVKTFMNTGLDSSISYKVAPEFRKAFTGLQNFALLRDFNCDGYEDVFTQRLSGLKVLENIYSENNVLAFSTYDDFVYAMHPNGNPVNLGIGNADIPSIEDIDGDGDLDIVTFGTNILCNKWLTYYKNESMENHGNCDTLEFSIASESWGFFREGTVDNLLYKDTCDYGVFRRKPRHVGSTVLTLDLDGDGDKDAVLGDVSFPNLVRVFNDGNNNIADMNVTTADYNYPSYSTPLNLIQFPAAYYLDVDNDGTKELMVTPNEESDFIENSNSIWLYDNLGTNDQPYFELEKTNFLQDEMIEMGSDAFPVFFDVNGDSLLDLIIGHYGYFDPVDTSYSCNLTYYRNEGSDTLPAFKFVTDSFIDGLDALEMQGCYPSFGDMDGDGDMDLLLGDKRGTVNYFVNNALPGDTAQFVLSQMNFMNIDVDGATQDKGFPAIQIIDLNNDNLPDLVIGERAGNINYFENSGTAANPQFSSSPTIEDLGKVKATLSPYELYSVPFFCRIDSVNAISDSSEMHLFVGTKDGRMFIFDHVLGPNLTDSFRIKDTIDTYSFRVSVSGGDLNSDGFLDLVTGDYAGGAAIYMNTDTVLKDSIGQGGDNQVFLPLRIAPDIKVYPNPSVGELNFTISGSAGRVDRVQVINLMGQSIEPDQLQRISGESNQYSMDITGLLPGIYFLIIDTPENSYKTKFIKQ